MPKGVMYTHGGFATSMFGTLKQQGYEVPDVRNRDNLLKLEPILKKMDKNNLLNSCLIACPLMHGTGMFLGGFLTHVLGGTIITVPSLGLDPELLLNQVKTSKAKTMVIVGDAFAKPILAELDKAKDQNKPYDISSLQTLISSGVIWSAKVKEGLLKHHDMNLFDSMGSSEGGMGSSMSSRDKPAQTAKFKMNSNVIVLSDENKLVEPGSGVRGKIGTSGLVPIGYYKDPEKSALTFKDFDGIRYSFPGDYAMVESDGSITLLGRGSNCINSAGEKIYPEEVEEAIKLDSNIYDCLVVGIDDEKFGQKVVAVASFEKNKEILFDDLIKNTRNHLSGYKLPKMIKFVDEVKRAPNGKADYKWALEIAKS
jgi:acyl-CoA synthetase (AMP-forming)/AMP-acid ligase II